MVQTQAISLLCNAQMPAQHRVTCGPGSAVHTCTDGATTMSRATGGGGGAPEGAGTEALCRELEAAIVPPHDQDPLPEWRERDIYKAEDFPKEEGPSLLRGHRPRQMWHSS